MSLSRFKLYGCCTTVEVNPSEYSDGATKVNFPLTFDTVSEPIVYVDAVIKDSVGLVSLPSITNRIRDEYECSFGNTFVKIFLNLTYVPHARQDRYTGDNSFTLQYSVIPLIIAADVDCITVEDPHSDVCVNLLREAGIEVNVITQRMALSSAGVLSELASEKYQYVVAPDAGSITRAIDMAQALGIPEANIIQLEKTRDPNTGHISFKPYEPVANLKPTKVIMFDDIGDGCWTHILAAQALKAADVKHITLVLTHGVLSKGVDHLYPAIDKLILINDWRTKSFEVNSLNLF